MIAAYMPGAEAHTFGAHGAGLAEGFAHPFLGLDHWLTMVAVGLWAGQLGGRTLWLAPVTFVGVMAAAAVLGLAGLPLPLLEPAISTSVLVLGLLIAGTIRMGVIPSVALVAGVAVLHGYAHGLELPATASPWFYGLGFMAATAALHGVGLGLGWATRQTGWLTRLCGTMIAATGLYILAGI
jgi:urease accessory protein